MPGYVCMYICGVYTCSVCMCLLETQAQLHYWLHLGHGAAAPSALSWAIGSSMMYFPVTVTFFKKNNFLYIPHSTLLTRISLFNASFQIMFSRSTICTWDCFNLKFLSLEDIFFEGDLPRQYSTCCLTNE